MELITISLFQNSIDLDSIEVIIMNRIQFILYTNNILS